MAIHVLFPCSLSKLLCEPAIYVHAVFFEVANVGEGASTVTTWHSFVDCPPPLLRHDIASTSGCALRVCMWTSPIVSPHSSAIFCSSSSPLSRPTAQRRVIIAPTLPIPPQCQPWTHTQRCLLPPPATPSCAAQPSRKLLATVGQLLKQPPQLYPTSGQFLCN